jgi:hypothetical protein
LKSIIPDSLIARSTRRGSSIAIKTRRSGFKRGDPEEVDPPRPLDFLSR